MHRDVTFGVHGALYGAGRRVGHALRYAMENEHREVRLAERNIRGSVRFWVGVSVSSMESLTQSSPEQYQGASHSAAKGAISGIAEILGAPG
jgi:hypothetical protein